VWSLEKFHQYTYARHVFVQSDHKPLEAILKKPLHAVSARLQRMVMRLQTYDIEVTWLEGKKQVLADTLSRAYINEDNESQSDLTKIHFTQAISISPERLSEIRKHTQNDSTLQILRDIIISGWPSKASDIPPEIGRYFHCRDELSFYDGIILRSDRVVIPSSMRRCILEKIHSSHLGITGCLRRARENVYWPNMTNEIKEFISLCSTCRSHETANGKEPLIPHDIPDRPWAKVGTDLYTIHNDDYLIVVDYFSGFFEVDKMANTGSLTVITKLKAHFARWGTPEVVVSDNGPQFTSCHFARFAEEWDFQHKPSSPGNSQANGKAEATVKIIKNIMEKASSTNSDVYLALLDLRNTPTQGQETSPAQRCLGRRTRTLLPTTSALLKPTGISNDIKSRIQNNQHKQKAYFDRRTRDLAPLNEGQTVRMQPFVNKKGIWPKGKVIRRLDERSYEIRGENNTIYRRNRAHVKPTSENICHPVTPPIECQVVPQSAPSQEPQDSNEAVPPPPTPPPPQSPMPVVQQSPPPPARTRYGRESKAPSKYNDFVLFK
jgi:hypothetical protein